MDGQNSRHADGGRHLDRRHRTVERAIRTLGGREDVLRQRHQLLLRMPRVVALGTSRADLHDGHIHHHVRVAHGHLDFHLCVHRLEDVQAHIARKRGRRARRGAASGQNEGNLFLIRNLNKRGHDEKHEPRNQTVRSALIDWPERAEQAHLYMFKFV